MVGLDAEIEPSSIRSFGVQPCGPGSDCGEVLSDEHLTVYVDQVATVGATGVWSVVGVTSPDLGIDVPEVALDGGTVGFDIRVPGYRSAHVGLIATNGCAEASAYEVALDTGRFDFPVPAPAADDPSCDDIGGGYVFAYATDDTTVPVGDPLLEAAAIEQPWLSIVPVSVVMEADPSGSRPLRSRRRQLPSRSPVMARERVSTRSRSPRVPQVSVSTRTPTTSVCSSCSMDARRKCSSSTTDPR